MVTRQLISPRSIAVIGGSDDLHKPGGTTLNNLISTSFKGEIYVVNPKSDNVQNLKTFKSVEELPDVDLAILAIPAKLCPHATKVLCKEKGCKALIILSAGFSEDSKIGAEYEREIVEIANECGCSIIGPNCIGVITPDYTGVFTKPIPHLSSDGIDFISGSGATIVFILEEAMQHGLRFSSIFSVGNSAQNGVEELLEYLDENYIHGKSAPIKMLYIESVSNPEKLYKHASSLIKKGAKICAIKSGYSQAGSRAASSHTGAMSSPDKAVDALMKKAGIIRCYSRLELVSVAAILSHSISKGNKMAIITHAGGPSVMLTDVLTTNGIDVPHISGERADELLNKLYPGSSVGNPIDFLSTGTATQLKDIIDYCENYFDVDSMCVIFGKPGLGDIYEVMDTILEAQKGCKKPLFALLTSIVNSKDEIEYFHNKGGISFPEEVDFGSAYAKVFNTKFHTPENESISVNHKAIREIIDSSSNGYLSPEKIQALLDAVSIPRAKEVIVSKEEDLQDAAISVGFPLVMKVIGPVHKSDVGGVVLNVTNIELLTNEFRRMMQIKDTTSILLQPMLSGQEIFVGAKREDKFGHLIMAGLGGIFIEVLKDINYALSPVSKSEAEEMIRTLKSYKLIQGVRGKEGVNEESYIDVIRRVSALCEAAPEIYEMDINPLLGNSKVVIAVDARIRIEKD